MPDIQRFEEFAKRCSLGVAGEIIKTQTTFFVAVCSFPAEPFAQKEKYRIHFRGKRDFSIGKGQFTSLQLFDNHPLLLKYIEPLVSVHLTSLVTDRKTFRESLDLVAKHIYGKWSSIERFCLPPSDWTLEKPYGILMEAPLSYANAVVEAAGRCGVNLILRNQYEQNGKKPRVLILDQWYIIADDFRA
jgi:hypothetical protein